VAATGHDKKLFFKVCLVASTWSVAPEDFETEILKFYDIHVLVASVC
jgi:hypothetical protein